MATTSIEWTRGEDGAAGMTWNPTTGCDQVSAGCDNCYALTLAKRLKAMGSAKYQRDGDPKTSGPGFGIAEHPDVLTAPLRWRKPRRIFVNSTSDLFHAGVSDEFIAQVWAVMAATPQHTYQVLTKRHARMRSLLSSAEFDLAVAEAWCRLGVSAGALDDDHTPPYPLPNVWLGTSVEDQRWADIRVPALLDTPAAVRFLSCEPLLGAVDLSRWLWLHGASTAGPFYDHAGRFRFGGGIGGMTITHVPARDLGWVIVGGESGSGARRMDLGWASSLVQQCKAAEVPVFMKQLGSAHGPHKGGDIDTWPAELQVREFPAVAGGAG